MLFVTEAFLLFFLAVYVIYWIIPHTWRVNFLILASFYFYATWSPVFAIHFVLFVAFNYVVMEIWRVKRWKWMFFSLQALNVLNIGFFKYYYFTADILGRITGVDGWLSPNLQMAHRASGAEILLPLAISFYTFQIMAYGIDIYRGVYDKKHTFREVLLFKLFFPQLIAGPIMRSVELLPQIQACDRGELGQPDKQKMYYGSWYILLGLVKKMMVADPLLAKLAPLFSGRADLSSYDPATLWMALISGFLMLYTDFSAYSDLARGFGSLLGFTIPANFKAPMFMVSISDFWRRWHLTFSLWIRDYIYIPLGGSRVAEWRNYGNLIFTFFLGGLWHGASYNFVIWGTLMGVMLSVESFFFKRGWKEWPTSMGGRVFRIGLSWILFTPTIAFFFAPSLNWIGDLYIRMLSFASYGVGKIAMDAEMFAGAFLAVLFFSMIEEKPAIFARVKPYQGYLLPVVAIVVVIVLTQFAGGPKDFFYFQF